MRNFRQLEIWKKGMEICELTYDLMTYLPDNEKFGLKSQMTRCAVSIPSNIAEGASRLSENDFARFIEIALGSTYELETQLTIANKRFSLGEKWDDIIKMIVSEQKMLSALLNKVRKPSTPKSLKP